MMKREYPIGIDMMDKFVNFLFKFDTLRNAIFDEVHMYDMLKERLEDPEAMTIGSHLYPDYDGWRGWSKSLTINRYYFNDIPEKNFILAHNEIELMEFRAMQLEFDLDEIW